jgi:hypothetical protein
MQSVSWKAFHFCNLDQVLSVYFAINAFLIFLLKPENAPLARADAHKKA